MQFTSHGNWFSSLPATLSGYGVDGRALLNELGVPATSARIPTQLTASAWQQAARRSGNSAIALQAAARITPADWGPLGLAVQHCDTLLDALQLCLRHSGYISTSVSMQLQPHPLGIELLVRPLSGQLPGHESMEFGMAAGHQILQHALGDSLPLAQLRQTRPAPQDPAAWVRQYHCTNIQFGCSFGSQLFYSEHLHQQLPRANPAALAHHQQQLQSLPARAHKDPWLAQVEQQILHGLNQGRCDQRWIASALDISPRQLQRQFKQRQLRFTELVDELRASQAVQMLADADRSLNDIALQLGFSDHSNFSRAFKRWYGLPPSTLRARD